MADTERQTPARSAQGTTAPAVPSTLEAALIALANSQSQIADLLAKQADYNAEALRIAPRRRKTMAEYLKEHPRKRLKHEVYQNGRLVNPAGLSRETIDKLDTLASGRYAEGMVQVVRLRDGVDGRSTRIHIFYSNKTLEQRMLFYMKFPTFTKLVNTIVDEMATLRGPVVEDNEDPTKRVYKNQSYAPVYDTVADPVEEEVAEPPAAQKSVTVRTV